ncbi:MAG TPA: glycosyltransferase family 9 protein [Chloroflexota bacterium]
MGRIVVFRPGALGDTLLTVDALVALRHRFPDAGLELVGHGEGGRLLQAARLVDEATDFDAPGVTGLFRDPPSVPPQWEKAELVVLWMQEAGGLFQAFRGAGARMVIAAMPEPEDGHVADYLVSSLASAGVEPLAETATLQLPGVKVGDVAAAAALVHPGSGSVRKNWPTDRFAALCRRLAAGGIAFELLEGPADREPVNRLVAALGSSVKVSRPSNTLDLAEMLVSTRLLIGNDSGVSHLAARLGVPTVAIFGASDPNRWAPRGPRVEVAGSSESWPSAEAVWAACQRAIQAPDRYPHTRALAERWSRHGYLNRGS